MLNFLNLYSLLESTNNNGNNIGLLIMLGVIVLLLVGMTIYSRFRNKNAKEKFTNEIQALKPGNKVKTVGGVCGVVVEIDREQNTFVLETGTNEKKSYVKFVIEAILQTDVQLEVPSEATASKIEEPKTSKNKTETAVEEKTEIEEKDEPKKTERPKKIQTVKKVQEKAE